MDRARIAIGIVLMLAVAGILVWPLVSWAIGLPTSPWALPNAVIVAVVADPPVRTIGCFRTAVLATPAVGIVPAQLGLLPHFDRHTLTTFWTVAANPNPVQRMVNLRALLGVIEAGVDRATA